MRRRRRDAEQPCYPQLAADAWMLAVEDLLGARTPVRRNEVLRYAAGFLLVRRWVALRRPGTPRERRYARLPADVAQLAQASFPGSFVYAVGGGNAPEDTRIRHLLEVLKVNDEMWDFCTTRFDAALAQAVSVPDAERKAYVMARSCSRTAAALRCFSEPWDSVQHGITLVLAELRASALEPRELFTQSFGPNRRHYNSCVGDRAAQEAYVRVAFDVALPPLEWTLSDPSGCGQALHASSFASSSCSGHRLDLSRPKISSSFCAGRRCAAAFMPQQRDETWRGSGLVLAPPARGTCSSAKPGAVDFFGMPQAWGQCAISAAFWCTFAAASWRTCGPSPQAVAPWNRSSCPLRTRMRPFGASSFVSSGRFLPT